MLRARLRTFLREAVLAQLGVLGQGLLGAPRHLLGRERGQGEPEQVLAGVPELLDDALAHLHGLERVPDPSDGRVKRVTFTGRGRTLIRDIEEITRETTGLFAAKIGGDRFRLLCELLSELDVAVNGVDAPVRVVGVDYEDVPR